MTALLEPMAATRTRGELLAWATDVIGQRQPASAALDATVLLAWLLRTPPTNLVADRDEPVSRDDAATFDAWVDRRAGGEPVAYITGHKRFMGLDLLVDRRALLVRPLTTKVAEIALEIVRVRQRDRIVAADVGTGSGALAVALTLLEPSIARFYATDISAAALTLARANARRYRVDDRVIVIESDLLDAVPEPVDLLVANLPYVPTRSILAGTIEHEPELAFDGGPEGTDILLRFIKQLPGRLRDSGALVMEIGPGQRQAIEQAIRESVPQARIEPPISQPWGPHVLLAELPPTHSHTQTIAAHEEG